MKYSFLYLLFFTACVLVSAQEKTTLILFTDSVKCPACIRLKTQVLNTDAGKKELQKFTSVITADRSNPATMTHPLVKQIREQIPGRIRLPKAVIVGADGKINGEISGFMPAGIYLKELQFYRDLPPLFQAVIRGTEEDVRRIMKNPGVCYVSPTGTTALILAIQKKRSDAFLSTLIRLSDKKKVSRQDMFLRDALFYAVENNRQTIIPLLRAAVAGQ